MVADPTQGSKSGPIEPDACSDLPKQAQMISVVLEGVLRGPGDINELPFLHNERRKKIIIIKIKNNNNKEINKNHIPAVVHFNTNVLSHRSTQTVKRVSKLQLRNIESPCLLELTHYQICRHGTKVSVGMRIHESPSNF